MEKQQKKSRVWLIILIVAAVIVVTVAGVLIGKLFFPHKPTAEPSGCEKTAQQFIEAYLTKDKLTQFDLFLYDARAQWEEQILKDHETEEAFCEVVQQQADEKGIEVTVTCFDDYLQKFHEQWEVDAKEVYGDYTVTVTATSVEAYSEEKSIDYVSKAIGAQGEEYFGGKSTDTIKQVYAVTVNGVIEGPLKTHNEYYTVFLVEYDNQWRVVGHTS